MIPKDIDIVSIVWILFRTTRTLNAAKNINYIKKCFKLKLFIIKFPTTNLMDNISTYLKSGAKGSQRFAIFKIL